MMRALETTVNLFSLQSTHRIGMTWEF